MKELVSLKAHLHSKFNMLELIGIQNEKMKDYKMSLMETIEIIDKLIQQKRGEL